MNLHRRINAIVSVVVFFVSQIVYTLTMQPSLPFWDCGEFAAVANTMGVPHPPGAPIFTVLGRIFTMLPFFENPVARINFLSTLFSSFGIMLTYLIGVRLLIAYKKSNPDTWSYAEKIGVYLSSMIGAFALAFSYSFWFNAVESEVYAMSIFLSILSFWIILRWVDEAEQEGSERWLLLVAFVFGIMLGVHLQALLAFFGIAVIYWAKKYEISVISFMKFSVVAMIMFLVIYPGIVKYSVVFIQKTHVIMVFIIPMVLIWGIYYTYVNNLKLLHLLVTSVFLIMLGYSSILTVYYRAQAKPPINENDPATSEKLFSYLNREQYGEAPLIKRRWSSEALHQKNYKKYKSDMAYLWEYQIKHMYFRYLGWNFIGREGDNQDDGVDYKKFWAIPFLIGLLGAIILTRKNVGFGLAVLAIFFMNGIALTYQLNMTEPQPRERDYAFVGSFFAFALWIAIGVEAIIEAVRIKIGDDKKSIPATILIGILGLVFINARMFTVNYRENSRAGNYAPFDYAYNLLQSCEKDAILFTNGDNDTFPLWYLQEGEGIRQDVRIINLSLANTDWYVKQLIKEEPRGAKKVRLNISDAELDKFSVQEHSAQKVSILVKNCPLLVQEKNKYLIGERTSLTNPFNTKEALVDTIQWTFNPSMRYSGRGYIRLQDRVVYETVVNNIGDRPIYFSTTAGDDVRIGLDDYLRLEGYAYHVVPLRSRGSADIDTKIHYNKLMNEFHYRNFNNPDVYYDEVARRMVANYKLMFVNFASMLARVPEKKFTIQDKNGSLLQKSNKELATEIVDKGLETLPTKIWETSYISTYLAMDAYSMSDKKDKAKQLLPELEELCLAESTKNPSEVSVTYYLGKGYQVAENYPKAIAIFEDLIKKYPEDTSLKNELQNMKYAQMMENNKGKMDVLKKKLNVK